MRKQNKRNRKVRKCTAGPNFSGQHLMHNKRTVNNLLRLADLKKDDVVVEVGAGKGALTFPLAEKTGEVLAVEYDIRFADYLRSKQASYTNMTVIQQDIRTFSLPRRPFKVVANIPYAITTPIMAKFLGNPSSLIEGGVIVMEYGAAKRFTTFPLKNPEILMWRMWFELKIMKRIPRDYFSPPPKVDSAALRIRRRKEPLVPYNHRTHFYGLAAYALQYPQLPISRALAGVFTPPQLKRLVKNLGISRDTVISRLNEKQWGTVFHTMTAYVQKPKWPKMKKK